MILDDLLKKQILTKGDIPKWLPGNAVYLTIMGSMAYGVSSDNSDMDVYGICIPPRDIVFPHTVGHILGFGSPPRSFEQWQMHHIKTEKTEYDFSIFSIVKFFKLAAENNPNILDSLYTPRRCILHSTEIGNYIRDNRSKFLHKGSINKFLGYAYSQLAKIRNKSNSSNPKRAADIEKIGYDSKFAYHVIRLALECEQILTTGTMDLEKDREILKSVRRGEWTLEKIEEWFTEKEKILNNLKDKSSLPFKPNHIILRDILYNCLEMFYGSIDNIVSKSADASIILKEIKEIVERYE